MDVSTKVNVGSNFASYPSWPCKMAAMVTLMVTSFLGMMIDSWNQSGKCLDLKGCEGIGDCRANSDDCVNQWYVTDFYNKGRLACAWVSTHFRENLGVEMQGNG